MGVVKGPAMSIAASGNVGPICYSRWRDLQIARGVWTGTMESSTEMVVYQGYLKSVAKKWGEILSEEEREAWRSYAREVTFPGRFGDRVHYSGYTLFVSRNVNRRRWGLETLRKPEVGTGNLQWARWTMMYDEGGLRLMWRCYGYAMLGLNVPDGWEAWLAGPFESAGRRALKPEFRFQEVVVGSYQYSFMNDPEIGKFYWMAMRIVDYTGVLTPFQYQQVAT